MGKGRCLIGTSGWNYPHWEGRFYPSGLPQERWLDHYCRYFDTVEINLTFYRLPERDTFQHWKKGTPKGFVFAAKASRFFTHMKKLKDPERNIVRFLENAAGLGEKLEVILFQLPPYWKANVERLKALIDYMERQETLPGVRSVLEVRHESWLREEVFHILEDANWSLCLADWPGLEVEGPVTADFVYLRRHGPASLYSSCYTDYMIQRDAERVVEWIKGKKDVYIYYNNDAYGYAVQNALTLKEMIEKIQ